MNIHSNKPIFFSRLHTQLWPFAVQDQTSTLVSSTVLVDT
jgi:hypothetical protein